MTAMRESGNWFPQGTTLSVPVEVVIEEDELVIEVPHGRPLRYALDGLRIVDRMAGLPLKLFTEGRSMLELPDGPMAKRLSAGRRGLLARIEQNVGKAILIGVFLLVPMIWALTAYVVPYLAGRVAPHISVEFAEEIGQSTFDSLSSSWQLDELELDMEQERALAKIRAVGARLADAAGGPWNYRFYLDAREKAQPNAFALPSGQIIISYSLFKKLAPGEVAAVLAHEIAHVERRHSLQALVSTSFWYVFSLMMLDPLLTTLPVLAILSYSRTNELEADCRAATLLHNIGHNPQSMVDALNALHDEGEDDEEEAIAFLREHDFISTHPGFEGRIEQAQECVYDTVSKARLS